MRCEVPRGTISSLKLGLPCLTVSDRGSRGATLAKP